MIILCDLDGIVADIFTPWLSTYNEEFKDNLTVDSITTYHVENHIVPIARKAIFDIIKRPGFFRGLKPLPGAIESLRQLHSDGHKIRICTGTGHAEGAGEKFAWVQEHLPFLHKHDIIIAWHKEMVKADVLIDDSPKNIKLYRKEWPTSHILTVAYPYNKISLPYLNLWADGYRDTVSAWRSIQRYIQVLEDK